MPRPKLRVTREAHKRKPHIRKGGVPVKGATIPKSTFKVKDRGKPGRTPKSERWYESKVETGWRKSDKAETRRRAALKAHGGNVLATGRALQALANVTTDKTTKRLAALDARYFFRKLR